MPRVMIPPPYRGPTQGRAELTVAGASVRECLNAVEAECPGFGPLVFSEAGELQRFVKLFRNSEALAHGALDAPVADDDEIAVVAAIGGG